MGFCCIGRTGKPVCPRKRETCGGLFVFQDKKMTTVELKRRINKTIKIFYKNDSFLIENKVNERSITHKLAEYLQQEFPEYHVDCEYNRMRKNQKMTDDGYVSKKLGLSKKTTDSYDTEATTVYPDIIIHDRGNNATNLLVIEVKKCTNQNGEAMDFDIKKIGAYIRELKYEHGLFLVLSKTFDETLEKEDWYQKK